MTQNGKLSQTAKVGQNDKDMAVMMRLGQLLALALVMAVDGYQPQMWDNASYSFALSHVLNSVDSVGFNVEVGFIFGHFFGVFLATTPHLDNVTDDHRYSWLLADFGVSIAVDIILILMSIFSKRGPFDFLGGLLRG